MIHTEVREMKRFAAALTALVLALCLSPCAYALVTLEKPDEAQMVYLPADDYESYRADFYLSALTAIERDGDDLYSTGYDDYISRDGYCIAEWSENVTEYLPRERVTVTISRTDDESGRKIEITGGISDVHTGV